MKTTVTAEEIEQSAILLEELRRWTKLTSISKDYNQGVITLEMRGNTKGHTSVCVDSYSLRNAKTPVTASSQCDREIGLFLSSQAPKLAEKVCEIILQHMPLPLEHGHGEK